MNENPTITLTLPLSAVNTIVNGLAELPAKVSMGVIQEVVRQAQAGAQISELSAAKSEPELPADAPQTSAESAGKVPPRARKTAAAKAAAAMAEAAAQTPPAADAAPADADAMLA